MTSFWSAWISVITIAVIVGCFLLVVRTRKSEVFKDTTTETVGHTFDGISELDNPLPRWWFNMFILSIVFGIVYLFLYPGLGNYKGYLNWTSYNQWEEEMAHADKHYQPVFSRYAQLSVEQISNDEKARQIGQRMFANNCALCHGQGGVGAFGFPNLTDTNWLYGGDGSTIETTITNGRNGAMPPWGAVLGEEGIRNVTSYVLSLSGQEVNPKLAAQGKVTFASTCVACHGADARGIAALGAPDLSDNTWLYGGSFEQVSHTIRQGRSGVMPAHKSLLSQDKIHLIAGYVYGLSR
ncbi:MAG: cytochrome-c oxidase, cbb3-type subunit III [Gammaproteobacteria bacterium]|nr:cytochrome-c oxidase, cbb3-type subunit III [Gammaproteobacteria bacterium]